MNAPRVRAALIAFAIAAATATTASFAFSSPSFSLSSDAFVAGATIPQAYAYSGLGCSGDNVSPALRWTAPPDRAKSFALTVFDPDARKGIGWWHWLIFNIPGSVRELKANAGSVEKGLAPAGAVQGVTDFETNGYAGPCPPPGDSPHHYVFTLYALDVAVVAGADSHTTGPDFLKIIAKHVVAKARLTGRFGR